MVIGHQLDAPTYDDLASWLTAEQLADPDVHAYVHRLRRAQAEEKLSNPEDWTAAERGAYDAGDWVAFSRLRGYTEDEIESFSEFIRLATLLDARYGEDFSVTVNYEVTQFDLSSCAAGTAAG